jgi:hypothetical protein
MTREQILESLRQLGITTYEQASDIVTAYYKASAIPTRAKYVIEGIIEEQQTENTILV